MSFSSNDTSSFHNNGMKGEVVGSRPTRCMCNLSIKRTPSIIDSLYLGLLKEKNFELEN